jgi:hypothetical protein
VKNNESKDTIKSLMRSQLGGEVEISMSSCCIAKKNQLDIDLIKYGHKK